MLTTLNIGLAVEGCRDNTVEWTMESVRRLFPGRVCGYREDLSETERTMVVQVETDERMTEAGYDFAGRIYKLACLLGQDCIAVKFAGVPSGDLIGPAAKSWGRYDPRYFIDYE